MIRHVSKQTIMEFLTAEVLQQFRAAAIKHVHTAAWDLVLVLQRVASMRFILSMAMQLWIKKSALLVANVLSNVQII